MAVDDVGKLTDHVSLGALARIVPRYVVDEILGETGKVERRSRLLPAHVVVYFVLVLSLFTDGYEEVIRKLVHGLRFARTWSREWKVPTTSALSQARARLGEEPLRALFDAVAVPVVTAGTPGAWLSTWRLMAIDACDDTLFHRDGRKVEGAGIFRSQWRSPFRAAAVAIALSRSTIAHAAAMVAEIAGWFPDRGIQLCADGVVGCSFGGDFGDGRSRSALGSSTIDLLVA